MRAVAAVPATGLLVGAAVGLAVTGLPSPLDIGLLIGSGLVAVWAWRASKGLALAAAVCAGFVAGGSMLSADAWRRAWRPSLRTAFEVLAHHEREQAAKEHRRLPEDDEAFAVIEGVLRGDASKTIAGVSFGVDVDSIRGRSAGPALGEGLSRRQTGISQAAESGRTGLSDPAPVVGGVQVTVVGSLAVAHLDDWRAGRRVRMPVQLRRPSRYLDPDVPDFERALARRGTTLVGTVKSGALVEVLARADRLDELTGAVRAYARRAIAHAVGSWSERSEGLVAAIVIGDRAGLDEAVQRRLQDAGTYHVIAISGGNIAIVAGLMLAGFRFGGVLGRAAMVAAMGGLVAYARLVGGGASVDRATLMAVVYFGARGLDQRTTPINTLAFVAGCLVLVQPLSVADPALVLTLGATLAILAIAPPLQKLRVPPPMAPAARVFAASLAAELMLLPVGAIVFSRVTFAGLALNFAAIPLMSVAQIAGMALVPLTLVSLRAAQGLGFVAHLAAAGLVLTADFVRWVPALVFRVAPPSWVVVVVYYVGITSACWTRRRSRTRAAAVAMAAVAALWIVAEPWTYLAGRGDGRLHLTFLDVGQGDSTLVRFPSGTTLLVDTGGLSPTSTFDIGDRVVAPVLRAAGVRRLDVMALTHGDPDHIGGATSVIREFRPKQVWEGIPVPRFEPLRNLDAEARAVGAHWTNVKTGDVVRLDGVDVLVRHPRAPDWERQRVRNDDSIVLELRWLNVSVVLTGDIGQAVERTLVSTVRRAPILIVKVPHHGSLTSSTTEFVRAIAPRIAVVSAGRSNHFGHPVPDVLQRYRDAGAEVFRTDQDGAVTIDTDGKSVDVHTFTGRTYSYEPQSSQRPQS